MRILLTNDDGIHAQGIAAMERELRKIGEVLVVAPSSEQSGVSHSITFLRPLVGHEVYSGDKLRGFAVDGTPADSVKLGITQYLSEPPDLVVSGINGGLNAGINVLYSGTVGGAVEGAIFGVTSFAVSLEFHPAPDYDAAAKIARQVIEQTLEKQLPDTKLFNLNIPLSALTDPAEVVVVPMGTQRYGHHFVERVDPKNRTYFWATNDPEPDDVEHETDVIALKSGKITLSPLQFDLTQQDAMAPMNDWKWKIDDES